jgi:serine/threonine protein kinase
VHESNRYPRPFGKYLLLRQIAIGGMAEVYLARQSGPAGFEKECVIKRILPSLAADQHFVQMFLDEARIAARLSHPNIVQIFDLGTLSEKDYYLAMEHVPGVDLQQVSDAEEERGGRLPLAVALRIISNVAEGLDHAHRATDSRGELLGLVHRDITPSNIIVSVDGAAKILDFGIAKAVARQERTEVGVIKGKIPYMSPEQVQGEALDHRSDLFSLGTMLYQLTTGRRPFDGQNAAELSLKILYEQPPAPEDLVQNYPPQLGEIVRRALNKRKAERFGSARELQEALDELLVSHSIRCTAHDVSAHLHDLFPDLRERTKADHALGPSLPVEVTEPTMPFLLEQSGPRPVPLATGESRSPLDGPDLSSASLGSYDDVRRNLGGHGSGGSKVIIALLVLAVAAGFYYLTAQVKHTPSQVGEPQAEAPLPEKVLDPQDPNRKNEQPKPEEAAAAPAPAVAPSSDTKEEAAAAPAPAVAPSSDTKIEPPIEKDPIGPRRPEAKAPAARVVVKRPVEMKRSSAKAPAETAHTLPRLPQPPPASDDEP